MWTQLVFTLLLIASVQVTVSQEEEEQQERPALPSGLEIVDPKELGLSEGDLAKYFGNVKNVQTLNLPGSKAQILTVGFDDNEKINLQNFEQLSTSGLEGDDRNVAQSAFQQFQSLYGSGENNETMDLDGLTTLFSKNPKLDVFESLNLLPHNINPNELSKPVSSQKQKQEYKSQQNQASEENLDLEQQKQQGQLFFPHQQVPTQFFQQNHIPQQQPFLTHQQYLQQHQPFLPFPPSSTIRPQLVQDAPSMQSFIQHPPHAAPTVQTIIHHHQLPPVLVAQPQHQQRGPPPTLQSQQQFVHVRPMAPPPLYMQIPTAQPQYVHIRQKGEPQPQVPQLQLPQHQQLVQLPLSLPPASPPSAFSQEQYIQFLQQLQLQPTPTPSPYELNYAHQSHPMMIFHNPPVLGHTAFLDMYKDNSQEQHGRLKDLNLPNTVDLTTNSLKASSNPSLYPESNHGLEINPYSNLQFTPQAFSTLYKHNPALFSGPLLPAKQQLQQYYQLQPQRPTALPPQPQLNNFQFTGRPQKPIGSHYQGRHIANIRRPMKFEFPGMKYLLNGLSGPAFGTQPQPPYQGGNHDFRQSLSSEPNSHMMPPRPRSNYRNIKPSPRPAFATYDLNPQAQQQQLRYQNIIPYEPSRNGVGLREPTLSMPLIKISMPENAMRTRRGSGPNKFLEEAIHAFGNKLS